MNALSSMTARIADVSAVAGMRVQAPTDLTFLLDQAMLIVGVDVGSVRRKGGFSWATPDEHIYGDDDPTRLGSLVVEALNSARRVALAFECPLAVPIPSVRGESWTELGRARRGEGNRSWSAGAGTGALATGLVALRT